MPDRQNIWVVIEREDDVLSEISRELMSEGRNLADKLRDSLCGVIFGSRKEELPESVSRCPVDKLYFVENISDGIYDIRMFVNGVVELADVYKPSIMLFGATPLGSEMAARAAVRLQTGLVTDCVMLEINNDGLLAMSKPIQDGKLTATYVSPAARPQMATVRPRVFEVGEPRKHALQEFADALGGSVGGSRVAVDKGWLPLERQIGQTGKRVSPRLFVAIGISGATQFQMGMRDSEKIIAINIQRNASIFKIADLKVVGDLHEILPVLKEQLNKIISS